MLHQARPGQNFNPRSHERSDTTTVVSSRPFALFQSTLPREERLSSLACMLIFPIFQSTLPREERQMHALKDLENAIFQSTLPREERLNRPFRSISSCISIHAPTRGATCRIQVLPNLSGMISIHAPTRGATKRLIISDFITFISIHAPTRGATCAGVLSCRVVIVFQSTLPREERQQYCTKNLFIFIQYRQ